MTLNLSSINLNGLASVGLSGHLFHLDMSRNAPNGEFGNFYEISSKKGRLNSREGYRRNVNFDESGEFGEIYEFGEILTKRD